MADLREQGPFQCTPGTDLIRRPFFLTPSNEFIDTWNRKTCRANSAANIEDPLLHNLSLGPELALLKPPSRPLTFPSGDLTGSAPRDRLQFPEDGARLPPTL